MLQALKNSSFWANQVENNESQEFFLFYIFPKIRNIGKANKAIAIANMPEF